MFQHGIAYVFDSKYSTCRLDVNEISILEKSLRLHDPKVTENISSVLVRKACANSRQHDNIASINLITEA